MIWIVLLLSDLIFILLFVLLFRGMFRLLDAVDVLDESVESLEQRKSNRPQPPPDTVPLERM
jgi:hypothetical protein